MRALILLALAGCAAALGGLEEGRARESGESGPPAAHEGGAEDAHSGCGVGWLPGYVHRTSFEVHAQFSTTLTDYTLRLFLDTRSLMAQGRLRPDARDLRITAGDGVTPLAFAFQGELESEAAKIWVHYDVPGGTSRLYAYYGGPAADAWLSVDDVFTSGIIPNPHFDADDGGWVARGQTQLLTLGDGGARVAAVAGPGPVPISAAWCASVELPEGHDWEVVFDLAPETRPARTRFIVFRGGVGEPLFGTELLEARHDLQANGQPLEPGLDEICFGVQIDTDAEPGLIAGTFMNPRVRPRSLLFPTVTLIEHEDVTCNP